MRSDMRKKGRTRTSSQRARARSPADPSPSEVKRERVWQVVQLMARGEYRTAETDKLLAEEWGIPLSTVQGITAEASRTTEFLANDRAKVLEVLRARLHEIASQDAPDRVQAIRTLLEHHGELWQRQKHEVTLRTDPFDGWTQAEIDHYAGTGEVPERLKTKGKQSGAADG